MFFTLLDIVPDCVWDNNEKKDSKTISTEVITGKKEYLAFKLCHK